VGSLLFVGSFAFGAHTLREFALALFIGIAIGTYSSIFVAAPLLAIWKEREEDWVIARKRAMRRRSGGASAAIEEDTQSFAEVVPAGPLAPTGASGAAPRAPRKRKKRR
ncbi:MAG: protein translocase subunit SecF, partial [Acidimicrobiia bacterium]|nr:protein translocase subunit SecF [Acidimicrobiia bacterium]